MGRTYEQVGQYLHLWIGSGDESLCREKLCCTIRYHLYEAEVFSDLLAYSAIGLFIHPFSMDEDDFEILMKFYETAYADTESLTIVFMDAVEIPPSLADTSIYIYKDCAEWIARVRKSLSYCEGMRERERNEMLEMMGECGEEE